MKLALLMALFLPLLCLAQEGEPLNSDLLVEVKPAFSLKLMGRGVQNEISGESLGLACVTATCSVVRMIYFYPFVDHAYLYGEPIQVSSSGQAPTEIEVRDTIHKLVKEYQHELGTWSFGSYLFSPLLGENQIGALFNVDGWNWFLHLKQLSQKQFQIMLDMKNDKSNYFRHRFNIHAVRPSDCSTWDFDIKKERKKISNED